MTKTFLNPDMNIVKKIREALKRNNGYCPCIGEQTKDTKCPCKEFREEKICHCNLYITTNMDIDIN